MELKPGLSALVTGGASGIGEAISIAFAERGIFVTVVDLSEENGKQVTAVIEKINAKFHQNLKCPSALFVKCDVTDSGDLSSAFAKHLQTYGGLDICINNAGISTAVPLHNDPTDGSSTWKRTINVNLVALIHSTILAVRAMQAAKRPGVIINMASSSGLYPSFADPAYSASKTFGGPFYDRPTVEDLAFAVASFVHSGGSYFNYYMGYRSHLMQPSSWVVNNLPA